MARYIQGPGALPTQAVEEPYTLIDAIMDPVEALFDSLGLMSSPWLRFAVGLTATYAVLSFLKPSFCYVDVGDGKRIPKNFKPLASEKVVAAKPEYFTYFTPMVCAFLVGAAFALFI